MSGIAIYVEGGGDSADGKAALRQGFDAFLAPLKERARSRGWRWRLVPCGGRDHAKAAFLHARESDPATHALLLVDSEARVDAAPVRHLTDRDRWDLAGAGDDDVHLMAQVMETWLVAHPDALASFYGQGFRANALPRTQDLEVVDKGDVQSALHRATRDTQKGAYHKTRHAAPLLGRIDPAVVGARCRHCQRLVHRLTALIPGA